jgi:hypothetical protein
MLLMLMQLAGAASVNSTTSEQTPPRNKFKRLSMARARLILKVAFALICPIEQTPPWPPRRQVGSRIAASGWPPFRAARTGRQAMCNDYANRIPYTEYLAAFGQTRIPVK